MAVLLPKWPVDRLKRLRPSLREGDRPLVLYEKAQSALRLYALDDAADRLGLFKGQALADARAICPFLLPEKAQAEEDAKAFDELCERFFRYSPIVSIHGVGEVLIDITGCQNLFGGEDNILRDIKTRLDRAGFLSRIVIADTAGAAWALARCGKSGICPEGGHKAALAPLPVKALRLESAISEKLKRLGLKKIGQLYDMPRAPLTARFTEELLMRLGQALGTRSEPLTYMRPRPSYFVDIKLAEPIASLDAVFECLKHLSGDLEERLEKAGTGARRFEFTLFRVDNKLQRLAVGASTPARKADHMTRLFMNRLEDLGSDYDAGFGFEQLRLAAFETDKIYSQQGAVFDRKAEEEALAELKDRLSNRLGLDAVCRLEAKDTHLPERADVFQPVMASRQKALIHKDQHVDPGETRRPIRLLPQPEEIEALAQVPDGPPIRFKWRKISYGIAKASGPERISDEWWRQEEEKPTRDYYRVEDTDGRRYWIFREGLFGDETLTPKWFLHGFFP